MRAMVAGQEELWDAAWGSASVVSRRAPARVADRSHRCIARTCLAVAVAVAAVLPCSGLHHGPAQHLGHPGLAGRRGGMHASSGTLRLRGGEVDVLGGRDPREAMGMRSGLEQWMEDNFPVQSRKELGHACLGFAGVVLVMAMIPLPVIGCFMNRAGLMMANVLLVAGSLLVAGPRDVRRFLLAPKRRMGAFAMATGFVLICQRWVLLGFVVEFLGFLDVFGHFLDSSLGWAAPFMPRSLSGFISTVRGAISAWVTAFRRLLALFGLAQRAAAHVPASDMDLLS